MTNEKLIIIQLTQAARSKKRKINLKIKYNTIILYFILFLWKIKIIYGYSLQKNNLNNKTVTLFIKNIKLLTVLPIKPIEKNVTKLHIKKQKKWLKNTLFVIKIKKKYLEKSINNNNKLIGGFLIATIF